MFQRSALCLLLVGCGAPSCKPDQPPVTRAPLRSPADAAASPAALPDPAGYTYSPVGVRDPFQATYVPSSGSRGTLGTYTLTGIIWGVDSPSAMLVDDAGVALVVREGSYVGEEFARVTAIRDGEIILTEEYMDPAGQLVSSPTTLRLGT